MKYVWLFLVTAVLLNIIPAIAAGLVTARAGQYTVELSSQPSPPMMGENLLVVTVKDGEKPLAGAAVDVHIDMTTMPMPADAKAMPGTKDGEYGATVNLSMAGVWKVDIAVQQMAGMKMAGDGAAHIFPGAGLEGLVYQAHRPAPAAGFSQAETPAGRHHLDRPRFVSHPVLGFERAGGP